MQTIYCQRHEVVAIGRIRISGGARDLKVLTRTHDLRIDVASTSA